MIAKSLISRNAQNDEIARLLRLNINFQFSRVVRDGWGRYFKYADLELPWFYFLIGYLNKRFKKNFLK